MCHTMPFTKQHSAYAWVVTCILFLINLTFHNLSLHNSYKLDQPFTDYFLRLPYSELLEKRVFRSRANRRLVLMFPGRPGVEVSAWFELASFMSPCLVLCCPQGMTLSVVCFTVTSSAGAWSAFTLCCKLPVAQASCHAIWFETLAGTNISGIMGASVKMSCRY